MYINFKTETEKNAHDDDRGTTIEMGLINSYSMQIPISRVDVERRRPRTESRCRSFIPFL